VPSAWRCALPAAAAAPQQPGTDRNQHEREQRGGLPAAAGARRGRDGRRPRRIGGDHDGALRRPPVVVGGRLTRDLDSTSLKRVLKRLFEPRTVKKKKK
jgi:hypothetical protein